MPTSKDNSVADTNRDLTDSIDRLTMRLEAMDRAAKASGNLIASTAKAGVYGVGAVGVGTSLYRSSKKFGAAATAINTGRAFYGFGNTVGGTGRLMQFAKIAGPLAISVVAISKILQTITGGGGKSRGGAGGFGSAQTQSANLLADIYKQSLKQWRRASRRSPRLPPAIRIRSTDHPRRFERWPALGVWR